MSTHIPDATQPGLWAHSHDAEHDLMKEFIVYKRVAGLRVGIASFDTSAKAWDFILSRHDALELWRNFTDAVIAAVGEDLS